MTERWVATILAVAFFVVSVLCTEEWKAGVALSIGMFFLGVSLVCSAIYKKGSS